MKPRICVKGNLIGLKASLIREAWPFVEPGQLVRSDIQKPSGQYVPCLYNIGRAWPVGRANLGALTIHQVYLALPNNGKRVIGRMFKWDANLHEMTGVGDADMFRLLRSHVCGTCNHIGPTSTD